MRTTNNLFRKVHNCIHFKWWFTKFERKCNILEIFHYFQYFKRLRSMEKWQISKPKFVDWYLDFSKEFYTTLKSVISSFKVCFQNYGLLKRKFLRPKKTTSTFLKFELSRLSGPMLKTQKNAIRNQFERQWFNVISYQKPPRVYQTDLIKFKAVFWQEKQSLAIVCYQTQESGKVVKGQSTIINLKKHNVFASRN